MTPVSEDTLWQAKLHARLHDSAEKALVLFRNPSGHEEGMSRALHSVLFADGIPDAVRRLVRHADWWASAADRPQLPENVSWAQLRWTGNPVLIHPLTGKALDLHSLAVTGITDVDARSLTHFRRLIVRAGRQDNENAPVDWRRTLLAYWRFGPELGVTDTDDNGKLGALWQHLPSDTRIPDHSIWDHLDLTSAFAGAFAADAHGEPALLALSIGPVQPFIAAARSTSDMWAGSHLLARLSWEAMRVVCERLGPDAIVFPRLRGIPQVDLWLRDECGLPRGWFGGFDWTKSASDGNPLFTAALPNRFVAVVPANAATEIAEAITHGVREWLQELGGTVVDRLLEAAGFRDREAPRDESNHACRQMRDQLDGFPEVHWAAVPFSLAPPRNTERQTDLDTTRLSEAMALFFGARRGESCGFLASPAWQVLQREMHWDTGQAFHAPNPGVLYPAVYDLAERVLAAAKAVRPFEQTRQRGWRCSLTGETEWLTTDPAQLEIPYRRAGGHAVGQGREEETRLGEAGRASRGRFRRSSACGLPCSRGGSARRSATPRQQIALSSRLTRWRLPRRLIAGCDAAVTSPTSFAKRLNFTSHHRRRCREDSAASTGEALRSPRPDACRSCWGKRESRTMKGRETMRSDGASKESSRKPLG